MPAQSSKAWLVVTVLGALLSFTAAVVFSLSGTPKKQAVAEDDESLPNITVRQPSKDLGIATRRDLLPGAPAPALRLTDELDTLHEAREAARLTTSAKKPAAKGVARPPTAAKKPAPDLKDPFGKGGE